MYVHVIYILCGLELKCCVVLSRRQSCNVYFNLHLLHLLFALYKGLPFLAVIITFRLRFQVYSHVAFKPGFFPASHLPLVFPIIQSQKNFGKEHTLYLCKHPKRSGNKSLKRPWKMRYQAHLRTHTLVLLPAHRTPTTFTDNPNAREERHQ